MSSYKSTKAMQQTWPEFGEDWQERPLPETPHRRQQSLANADDNTSTISPPLSAGLTPRPRPTRARNPYGNKPRDQNPFEDDSASSEVVEKAEAMAMPTITLPTMPSWCNAVVGWETRPVIPNGGPMANMPPPMPPMPLQYMAPPSRPTGPPHPTFPSAKEEKSMANWSEVYSDNWKAYPGISELAMERNSSKAPEQRWWQSVDPDTIRDLTLGFADGLTVPFALTAGLSAYVSFFSL